MHRTAIRVTVDSNHTVSGMLDAPRHPSSCLVLAHGAGAGMTHPFMAAVAEGMCARDVATLRYQFPAMEQGSKRPDRPALATATVRAAVAAAANLFPGMPLLAGGKSFGGRMTSQAQAGAELPGVNGLVFFGFPLHPAKRPSDERARHLSDIAIPMLFLQGTRDALAEFGLLQALVARLGAGATLVCAEGADHAFHVPLRSGRTDSQVLAALLDATAAWASQLTS
jgi:predicted alpha/beta-hydrolase family hydrolase